MAPLHLCARHSHLTAVPVEEGSEGSRERPKHAWGEWNVNVNGQKLMVWAGGLVNGKAPDRRLDQVNFRIMVSIILDYLRAGESFATILREYPALKEEDVRAALGYAAWLAREEEQQPLHTETTG